MASSGATQTHQFKFPVYNPPKSIIFLDVDGVLNYQIFYEERYTKMTRGDNIPLYKVVKKHLKKLVKKKEISRIEYYRSQMCPVRMQWLNELCESTNSAVVLSASMRASWDVLTLNKIFHQCGATFQIIDKTGHSEDRVRGVEIHNWLKDNCMYWFGVNYYDFYRYVILDDDSDMLLWQQNHFFHVDAYAGLTPNICYRIRRFFNHETF